MIEKKNLNEPDETTKPAEKMRVDVITVGGLTFQKVTVEPGWQWSKHLKPVVNTASCEKHHLMYLISGRLRARMDNGEEEEFSPGELIVVPPGHDGWAVGEEPAVWLEIPH